MSITSTREQLGGDAFVYQAYSQGNALHKPGLRELPALYLNANTQPLHIRQHPLRVDDVRLQPPMPRNRLSREGNDQRTGGE